MFCLKYYPFENYFDEVDELKIEYRPADRTLKDFLQKYSNKSIIIEIKEELTDLDVQIFKGLYDKYKNIKLIIDFDNKENLTKVQENEIPFFFGNFVTTIDQLNGLIPYHPTDMYICEELGFSLDRVSTLLHANNIKVRVFPNICQSSFYETPSLKQFFIRPDDIDIYSVFVDVFEIISDQARQQVLLKIYKQQKWLGKIKEVIPTFDNDLDNKFVLRSFGAIRSKCGKRCMYNPEVCNICDRFVETAQSLKDNHIMITKPKSENPN